MTKKQEKARNPEIFGQSEYMEGDIKVVVTEYTNGAQSHRKIRPKRPFYKHIWFYVLIVALLYIVVAALF